MSAFSLIGCFLIGSWMGLANPARADDHAKAQPMTTAEKAEYVRRQVSRMPPEQRQALLSSINQQITELNKLAKTPSPYATPRGEPVQHEAPGKTGVLDRLGNYLKGWFKGQTARTSAPVKPSAPADPELFTQIANLQFTVTAIRSGATNQDDEQLANRVFESIANATRLAYIICNESVLDGDRIEYWKDDIADFFTNYKSLAHAVGMVKVSGLELDQGLSNCPSPFPTQEPVGTAFVVGDGLIATNRHVAEIFAEKDGAGQWAIIPGLKVTIEFAREYPVCASQPTEYSVTGIAGLHGSLDLALLNVAGESLPAALSLATSTASPNDVIAVIGYPSCDQNVSRRDQRAVFMTPSGKPEFHIKRFQPGEIMKVGTPNNHFRHDASTLGGNSGSPVIRLSDGNVVGVHSSGIPYNFNLAIGADQLGKYMETVNSPE